MIESAAYSKRRNWIVATVTTVVFNTVVAVVLTTFSITPGNLAENLIYSHCIGLLILLGMLVPSTIIWFDRPMHPLGFGGIAIAATIFGLFGGRALAGWLMGHSVHWNMLVEASTFAISLGISAFAAFAATFYFWNRERDAAFALQAAQARERTETMARQLSETQLQLLRAQIEPHMLFNTLANLRALIPQDPAAAQQMLDHLIGFFRASLDASRTEWTSVDREFKLAADYLALLAIRLGERLRYSIELPAPLAGLAIPSMLVQPLVENAIKHGIEPSIRGGEIVVRAQQLDGQLALTVTDTGVGLREARANVGDGIRDSSDSDSSDSDGSGFGNEQLRARLSTLYGGTARFELRAGETAGTVARILLPLKRPVAGASAITSRPSIS